MFAAKKQFFTGSGGYEISRSVRLRSSASAYFTRTPASAGSQTTWTYSTWMKRGALSTRQFITMSGVNPNSSQVWQVEFDANNKLNFYNQTIGTFRLSTQVFRDASAWYHIVFTADTNNATAQNRFRCWVNGVEITAWDTNSTISSGYTFAYNGAYLHGIGAYSYSPSLYFDGYITETHFVDGQALTPSSFGESDAVTGVWKPKKYTGTYGTNGFYLNFSDNSAATATTIGKDYSGNGNNWTPNNISVTAGATYDSMLDVPTLYADGGNGRGNYAVLNPIDTVGTAGSIAAGNLNLTGGSAAWYQSRSGFGITSGKWYWEVSIVSTNTTSNGIDIGVSNSSAQTAGYGAANKWIYNNNNSGRKSLNGTSSAYGSAFVTNDVVGVAFDADAGTLEFYKNNTSQGVAASSGLPNPAFPCVEAYSTDSVAVNFGQRPFAYTPPTGFKALNTQNLDDSTIKKGNQYFDATTYTGTGASLAVVNSGAFQPDLVWTKSRSNTYSNHLEDAVRGVGLRLLSDSTAVEVTGVNGKLTSFNSNGFTQDGGVEVGASAGTYVAWQWNAGGSTVTNTSGSISAQVRANPSAGFSIVTYTGTGANATVGHGLGVTPSMVIVKQRNGARSWVVKHKSLAGNNVMFLEQTLASSANANGYVALTSSSVFSIANGGTSIDTVGINTGTYIAYCFAEVAGYSAFGSYTGNGSTDGPFVYCGFRPKYVLIKRTDAAGNWNDFDTSRNPYNGMNNLILLNSSAAESVGGVVLDSVSNGFKLRDASANWNASGGTYIFAAFAENPFKNSLAR